MKIGPILFSLVHSNSNKFTVKTGKMYHRSDVLNFNVYLVDFLESKNVNPVEVVRIIQILEITMEPLGLNKARQKFGC